MEEEEEEEEEKEKEEEERERILKGLESLVPVIPKTQESPLFQPGFWHQTRVLAVPAPFTSI